MASIPVIIGISTIFQLFHKYMDTKCLHRLTLALQWVTLYIVMPDTFFAINDTSYCNTGHLPCNG